MFASKVEAGNLTWDIVVVELSDAIRACDEDLLETIDHSSLHTLTRTVLLTKDTKRNFHVVKLKHKHNYVTHVSLLLLLFQLQLV